jgi:hypothetical protein
MYRAYQPLLREYKQLILENVKQAKQYVQVGKLSEDDLKKLIEIDPTPTRKFVGWMAKIWIGEKPAIGDLTNTIGEYNTLLNRGKVKTKDIYQFKSYKELKAEIEQINNSGASISNKDLESNYDIIIDTRDLLVAAPYTHAASRKLGLSHFAFRDCEDGRKDSAWCTTYRAPDHFNDYYYKENLTFYYIKVKSTQLIEKLQKIFPETWQRLIVTAVAVDQSGGMQGYDGLDGNMSPEDLKKYVDIIGIS